MSDVILVLDNVRSSLNVGAISRTADAMGVKEVVTIGITPHMQQPNDPRLPHVVRKAEAQIKKTALGAEKLLGRHFDDHNQFLNAFSEIPLFCLEQTSSSSSLEKVVTPGQFALIAGNEVDGVHDTLLKASTKTVEIPMKGDKESLNVSAAVAIALYALTL